MIEAPTALTPTRKELDMPPMDVICYQWTTIVSDGERALNYFYLAMARREKLLNIIAPTDPLRGWVELGKPRHIMNIWNRLSVAGRLG